MIAENSSSSSSFFSSSFSSNLLLISSLLLLGPPTLSTPTLMLTVPPFPRPSTHYAFTVMCTAISLWDVNPDDIDLDSNPLSPSSVAGKDSAVAARADPRASGAAIGSTGRAPMARHHNDRSNYSASRARTRTPPPPPLSDPYQNDSSTVHRPHLRDGRAPIDSHSPSDSGAQAGGHDTSQSRTYYY